MQPFAKILVPVDFSEHSAEALRTAVALGRSYGAALTLVHVFDPAAYAVPQEFALFTPMQLERLTREFEDQLAATKSEALKLGAARVETRLLSGTPAFRIADFAKDAGADLIVMGTHGRTGVRHLFLGSVAERVVRAAPCAVLTVKARKTEAE
jgi:nucleotide-binding universal stress UspA family protein